MELENRAASFTPDYVLMRELETKNQLERGSALRVDDAIIGTTRARDESERVIAEVLMGIERSFQPHDDKRLICRAYITQLGRTASRLREATARLERESADALRLGAAEKADVLSQLHHVKMTSVGNATLLASEVERAEAERAAQNDHMHGEFERMRREREAEAGQLGSNVARLTMSLESSRAETGAIWTQAQQQQRTLSMENEALRSSNANLTRELELARDAHGTDASTLRSHLTLLEADKRSVISRMKADMDFVTNLASDTQANLESKLAAARVEREAAVSQLRQDLTNLRAQKDAEVEALEAALAELHREKEASEMSLRSMMRKKKHEWDEESTALHGKIHRLESVQKAAMDSGTLRARQLLYWEHLKADASQSSMTWRGSQESLPQGGGTPSRRPGSPERRFSSRWQGDGDVTPSRQESTPESPH